MNEDAIKDSYGLFVTEGYNGTIEDYKELLNTNSDALNDAFELFKSQGYTDTINDFSVIMGVGKPTGVVEMDATVTPEPEPVSESMDLESEDISLGLEKPKKKEDKLGSFFEELIFTPSGMVDFFQDAVTALKQGYKQSETTDINYSLFEQGVNATDEQIEEFVKRNKEQIENSTQSAEYKQFIVDSNLAGGGFWGSVLGFIKNPTVGATVLASSMANQLGSMQRSDKIAKETLAGIGVGSAAGAAVGAATGPFAPITSAVAIPTLGLAAGTGALMRGIETSSTFAELLIEELDGEVTKEGVRKILENPEKLADFKNKARARGNTIAAIEAGTLGLSRGVGGKIAKAGFKAAKPITTATTASIESAGGMAGEAAGMYVAGQEMDPNEIFLEGIGSIQGAGLSLPGQFRQISETGSKNAIKNKLIEFNKKIEKDKFEELQQIDEFEANFMPTENSKKRKQELNQEDQKINNIVELYNPSKSVNKTSVEVSQLKNANTILDSEVKLQIKKGVITKEQGDAVRNNFRETQGNVNKIKASKIFDEQYTPELVDLLNKKQKLEQEVKSGDPSLTKIQSQEIVKIKEKLEKIALEARKSKLDKGATAVAEAIGFEVNEFDTSAELEAEINNINKEIKDGSDINVKEAAGQLGFILQYPDGKQRVLLNKEQALKENVVSTAAHEVLHGVLFNTVKNQGVGEALGKSLIDELNKIDADQIKNSDFKNRLNQYKESGINEDQTFEEALTLFSESLINGDLVYEENLFTKIGDFIRRTLAPVVKVKFNKGRDVYNFIRDYNRTIETGKGLKAVEKAAKGIAGKLTESQELSQVEDIVLKDSKSTKGTQASEEVQRIYEDQGTAGAFDIIQQFKPTVSKLAERRRDAPGFDRELLIDEIETGQRGILDLINSYDPSKGVPLAAYINKLLPARAIEASKRVLGEVFESDVTEQVSVAAPESDITIEEKVQESIKPTEEQKSKLRRQIKLPDEQVEKVREAVRKTFGTRLPPLQSPEFKKALRKAYDTELFKELKNNVFKTRGDYEFFMSQNWKALYDAIPQETLNQSFAPFREAVLDETGKQKREKTPEGERIFRKKNITKEEFLDYFFNPNVGVSTRGTRKDAIVRMLAQELGFDATMETIQEPKVAEKIEFLDKEKTVPKVAEKINREPSIKFSKSSATSFANDFNLDYYNINTVNGAKKFVKEIKQLVEAGKFPPGLLNVSMMINNKSYSDEVKEILRNKETGLKSIDFGKNIDLYSKTSAYETFGINGKELAKIPKSEFKKYNDRNAKMFKDFWFSINNIANDKNLRKYGTTLYHMIGASVGARNNPHSLGAEIVSIYDGDLQVNWEHAVPNVYAFDFLINAAFDKKVDFKEAFKVLNDNYKLIALDKESDKKVSQAGYSRKMPDGFDIYTGSWWQRYLNPKVAELGGINTKNQDWFGKGKDVFKEYNISGVNKVKEENIKDLNKEFNEIIENKTSIAASKTYDEAKARLVGDRKTKFRFFIPPSADDFMGLLYYTLGKGKVGDAQLKWYNENLISPFAQAMEAVSRDRNETAKRFKTIIKDLGIVPKKLRKLIPGEDFTQEQAVRVYVWDKQDMSIPGLSESDKSDLLDYIDNNKKLKQFADKLLTVNKSFEYAKPGEAWVTGNIVSDLKETLNTTKRATYLEQWQRNIDEIFSKQNLNKLEAAFGRDYRLALENSLQRMKTGRNRSYGPDSLTGRFNDWINGSVGAIMFFNTRSAILQTISAINFINFSDNNVFAAAKAFANQKQYWSDFKKLFNSDFLKDRREGLRMDINEADLATVAKQNGAKGVINRILKLGFTPTQIADSFAIASGGATFYRNRLNSLMKEGVDQKAAEKIAFQEFRETAEESQQSSRPDKISQQQAGPLGRIILAFANTPSQYARLMKKAALDLKNNRGDAKTNISKIVYYAVVQNLIFNAAQQALFALMFAEEEDEELKDKKIGRVANGMADSVLRGLGFTGAIASTVKNITLKLIEQSKKQRPEYQDAMLEVLKVSPPISSKMSKLRSAARTYDWNKKEMLEKGISLDNPAALALGQLTSAITNIPLDRGIKKVQNVEAAINDDLATYQRLALIGGWSKWDLGIQDKVKPKTYGPKKREVIKRKVVKRN